MSKKPEKKPEKKPDIHPNPKVKARLEKRIAEREDDRPEKAQEIRRVDVEERPMKEAQEIRRELTAALAEAGVGNRGTVPPGSLAAALQLRRDMTQKGRDLARRMVNSFRRVEDDPKKRCDWFRDVHGIVAAFHTKDFRADEVDDRTHTADEVYDLLEEADQAGLAAAVSVVMRRELIEAIRAEVLPGLKGG